MAKKISLEKHFLSLSKDSLIYGLGNAVLKVMALVTAPIFTRIFVPAEYGVISLIATFISFLSIFLIVGMDQAICISFYEYKKETKVVISSAFWFLFLWGFFITALISLFSGNLSLLIFKTDSYRILFLIGFWTAFFTLLINITRSVFRLEFRAKTFATVSIFNALVSTGLMILLVAYYHQGLAGYFTGSLVGTFLSFVLATYLIRKDLKFAFSLKRLKEMVVFGAFIVPSSLAYFVFDLSDRFFLNHYRTLPELGLYSIGINIASIVVFFSYALGQAWSPFVMRIYFSSKKLFHQFVPRFFSYYLIFFFILAVGISLFGLEILKILTTPKFYDASRVISPLVIAMVFSATNQVTALGVSISRKTNYLALCTALGAGLNIGLNFALIPKYGMVGAGWATAASYFFLTIAYHFSSQKFIPLELEWSKIIKLVTLSLAIMLLAPIFWKLNFWQNLIIKFVEFGIFGLMLYLSGVIEINEIQYLKKYFKRFLGQAF
jgi:O-antigen/teichoic acid export membrane protein